MKRTLIIAALLLSLPALTDALVDHRFRHEPERNVGYSKADRDGMARLVERTSKEAKPVTKRFEYPFACNDTDRGCLTLQADTVRSISEPKVRRVIVEAENGKPVVRWVHQ